MTSRPKDTSAGARALDTSEVDVKLIQRIARGTGVPIAAVRLLLPAIVLSAGGCAPAMVSDGAPQRAYGDSAVLGDGVVRAWVETGLDGRPTALGVDLPDAVVASVGSEGAMLSLKFPAMEGLPFRHVLFDWAPGGHPPGDVYAAPHWDAHFYTITPEERRAIPLGPTELRPGAELMPDGFVPVPGVGLFAFPEMGVHWINEDASELGGRPFDHTLIYGSWGDRTIFIEPMFTHAWLAGSADLDAAVPQPREVAEAGWYPTRYVIRRNLTGDGFRVALEGLRWRDAAVAAVVDP